MTLDDLERRNSRNRSVISPNSVAVGTVYVKVVEDTDTFCGGNVGQRISLTAILAGVTPSESVKLRHSPLASENLPIIQP